MPRRVVVAAGAVAAVLVVLLAGALMAGWRPFTAEPDVLTFGPDGDLRAFTLFEGQCARGQVASGDGFGPAADEQCGNPHDVEVVATVAPIGEGRPVSYPGEAELAAFGRAYCALYVDSDLLVPSAGGVDRDDLRMTAVVPSRAAFADPQSTGPVSGGRQVSCLVSRDDGEQLTDRFSVI
ncbi:hypothetical protein [Actinomycetospora lemnae]|uniref:Septum formation-related domain-containing protein n=1 Tax=Actinomycetospora lemnae TaxID=3019891 RepID=A0ABT5SYE6_9PSEU|nr:hypothetical protein [Actinomycetospora sp. DW7H6]MDD7967885.1 hypothetical protein [Actinomycetospora sp. DW7H6]